jgi:predicted DNA-binding transcriptional regulator
METPRRTGLPAHLCAFLYSCIDSIDQLDVLLLLQASGRPWTVREVGRELGIVDGHVRLYLESLAARGLVRVAVDRDLTYIYQPASSALRVWCEDLAAHVASARADVIMFVAGLPPLSIRAFAKAFTLREQD